MAVQTRAPRPLPAVGYALRMARDPMGFVLSMWSTGQVVPFPLPGATLYLVNDVALVRKILLDATWERGQQAEQFRPVLGDGLITSDGPLHLRNRRLVQPAFHRGRMGGYAEVMREQAQAMTAGWRDGQEIAVDVQLMEMALRVVGRTLFSADLAGELVEEVVRTVPILLDGVGRRARYPIDLLYRLPTPRNRAFTTGLARLNSVVDDLIARRRGDRTDHGDIISTLLSATDPDTGERLSDRQVRDEVITMLIAGSETTSNTVAWVLHLLGSRPDLRKRLQAEVDEVLGDRPVTFADVPKLEFLRRVVTETLRLYPAAWLFFRRATVDSQVGDVTLPAGTPVMLPIYSIQRDPTVFPDPEVFDPDRWAPERLTEAMRPSFLAFSAGRHVCAGEAFAWAEAGIILAVIARQWSLEPVPGRPVGINSFAALRPTQLPMVPRRRRPVRRGGAASAGPTAPRRAPAARRPSA